MDNHFQAIRHRNTLSKVFVTFPQCGDICTKDQLVSFFNENFVIEYHLVVQEPHTDGGVHLHALFWFKKGKLPTKAQILSATAKHWPNDNKRIDVRSVRSENAAIKYLVNPVKNKEIDSNPIANFDLSDYKTNECEKLKKVARILRKHEESEEEIESIIDYVRSQCDCEFCDAYRKKLDADIKLFLQKQNIDQQINIA